MEQKYKYHTGENCVERISVIWDSEANNPRLDDEGLAGEMFCQHRRYRLGDKTDYKDIGGLNRAMAEASGVTVEEICEFLKKGNPRNLEEPDKLDPVEDEEDLFDLIRPAEMVTVSGGKLVCLPLYLYDHSGLSMSTGSFKGKAPHADFDSGIVGVIWTTTEKVRKLRCLPENTPLEELIKLAEDELEQEVRHYSCYLEGNIYSASVERVCDGEWEEIETISDIVSLDGTPELVVAADEYFGKGNWIDELPEREWFKIMATVKEMDDGEFSVEAALSKAQEKSFLKPEDETLVTEAGVYQAHCFYSKECAEKVLEQLNTMRIKVKRVRPSVTQGELHLYVNEQFITNFGDKIELIKPGCSYYGETISGWASTISDESVALVMLWDPYEWLHHFSVLLKNRCGIDLYLDEE